MKNVEKLALSMGFELYGQAKFLELSRSESNKTETRKQECINILYSLIFVFILNYVLIDINQSLLCLIFLIITKETYKNM